MSVDPGNVPNPARIYDYLLGGDHNSPIDRAAGERLKQLSPFVAKAPLLQRRCLRGLAAELTERRGFDVIIDFASGLPTQDHLHDAVRPGTTVIYSDIDPLVVKHAREILDGSRNTYYFLGDARRPDLLLSRPEVQTLLGGRHDIAMIYWGVSAFLTDDDLRFAATYFDAWAGPQSVWAFNAQLADLELTDEVIGTAVELYRKMGTPLYLRPLSDYRSLLRPWSSDDHDFVDLLAWNGLSYESMSDEDKAALGVTGGGYGAYLTR